MYTEQDIINLANATIKMFDNSKEQITLLQTSYLKQIETLIETKRKEKEEAQEEEKTLREEIEILREQIKTKEQEEKILQQEVEDLKTKQKILSEGIEGMLSEEIKPINETEEVPEIPTKKNK
jgi:chromosome segregation ATPase